MLKEHAKVFRKLLMAVDAVVAAGVYVGVYLAGAGLTDFNFASPYFHLAPFFLIVWIGLFYILGIYDSFRTKPLGDIISIVTETAAFGFVILGSTIFIFKLEGIERAFFFLLFVVSFVIFTAQKAIFILFFRYFRRRGYNLRHVLIVGTNKRAQNFIDLINRHSEWGYRVVGLIDDDPERNGVILSGHRVIGSFDDLPAILHNNVIDHVVFIVPRQWFEKIERLLRFCETEGIPASVAVDLYELSFARARQTDFHGFPLMTFETTPDKIWHLLLKRCADMVLSAAALLMLAPLLATLALIIKRTSSGSVFFRQMRCGLNGRRFTLYKFRTMVEGAEARQDELLAHNEMKGPVFKMKDDPRVTKAGRFLRKFSLDELPQFWNVLKGDMSIVGPRPPLPLEVEKYDNWQRRRLSMRPGLTCLWQVRGRNSITDFNEWMKLDLEYIDNWSLWLDLKIFLKTIPVVLFGIGAK